MKDIYANAEHARAWLGSAEDGSDEAIAELSRVGDTMIETRLVESIIEFSKLSTSETQRHEELDSKIRHGMAPFVESALQDFSRTLSFVTKATELLSREYWKRVWILQEIIVSSSIVFQCGNSTISFPTLYASVGHLHLIGTHITNWQLQRSGGIHNLDEQARLVFSFGISVATKASQVSPTTKLFGARLRYQKSLVDLSEPGSSLFELLARIHVTGALKSYCGATNPRDRIFALLGVANDMEKLGLVPDYDQAKSCSEIYTQAARAIIKSGQVDLLSLSQSEGKQKDVPSWVPDWRADWILRPCGQLPWDTAFKAFTTPEGLKFEALPELENGHHEQLLLHGCQVDVIEKLGNPWTPHYIDGCVSDTPGIAAYLLDIANLCQDSNIKFAESKRPIYADNFDRNHAHTRIPVADQEEIAGVSIGRSTQKTDEGYSHVMQDVVNSANEALCRLGPQEYVPQGLVTRSSANMLYRNMMGWQRDRRPFLSEKGYVGLAPLHVQAGDVIVLFVKAKFPYVLRDSGNGTYSLVGEAYVHGIMYGEFFGLKTDVDVMTFTLA
jgi:hypothetical protein